MDAVGAFGPALGGAEQVAEPEVGVAARLGPRLGVELGRRFDHRVADGGEVAGRLVLGQAFADRRLARQPDSPGAASSART